MTLAVILCLILVVVLFVILRPYFRHYDTVCAYTGGLGSGKSFLSVDTSVRELKKNRFRIKLFNIIHRKKKLPKPMLYSTIPVRISKKEYSLPLTEKILTLQERIVPGSICFLDEIDVFANQFEYNNPNIIDQYDKTREDYFGGYFDEFVRLFRHYNASVAVEPKLIVNTQCTSNIVTVVRRRINTVFFLSRFRIHLKYTPFAFYTCHCRNITITDEVTNINEGMAEDNDHIIYGFVPFFKRYDTHCYSERVKDLPFDRSSSYKGLKQNHLTKCPRKKIENNIFDFDESK